MQSIRMLAILLAIASPAFSQTANVRVQINETGIADWGFLNPKTPQPVGTDQSLEFVNATGGRTFVVTLPFELPADEQKSSYSLAAVNRGRPLADFVNAVLVLSPDAPVKMSDRLERLRILEEKVLTASASGEGMDLAKATIETLDGKALETLYWTASCGLSSELLERLRGGDPGPFELRRALDEEATALVGRLLSGTGRPRCEFGSPDVQPPPLTSEYLRKNYSVVKPISDLDTVGAAKVATDAFNKARSRLAAGALRAAIREAIRTVYETESSQVLQALEALRPGYQKEAGRNERARCRYYFVRAAATAIATYGPEGRVPYSSPLLKLDPRDCGGMPQTSRIQAEGEGTVVDAKLRSALMAPLSAGAGMEIADCSGDAKVVCAARLTVPPNQRAVVDRSILERRSDPLITFTISFFDEAEPPANATGYVFLHTRTANQIQAEVDTSLLKELREGLPSSAPKQLLFSFAADAGADYALPEKDVVSHVRRTTGAGSLGFQFVGPFDVSATLQFKKGEFGGGSATNQVQATQYQAKVFGPAGTVLEYGRFVFARPSSSIAVSESGEGLRFGFRRFTLGYLVRRESDNDKQTADRDDDDSYALVSQLSVPVPLLRSLTLTGVWGNEKKDFAPAGNPECIMRGESEDKDRDPCATPYQYATFGFDTRFAVGRSSNLVAGLAAYHSVRHLRAEPRRSGTADNFVPPADGEGDTALLTLVWSRLIEQNLLKPLEQSKPWFSLTGFLGYGSADDPATADTDESYLGENAGYANDRLFLSSLVKTKRQLGRGLSNKWYAGVQYSNATWSPLRLVAELLRAEKEVESVSTTVTLHKYHLIRDVQCGTPAAAGCDATLARGKRDGGYEADVEFLIETPKNVRWTLGGAWYRRSSAARAVGIRENPWMAVANVSIKFNHR